MFNELLCMKTIVLYNICVCHLIPLFIIFPLALTNIQCKDQGDCNDGKNIKCGICVNNDNSKIGKCTFPFPYMFSDSKECTRPEFCERNCSNHGDCDMNPMTIFHSNNYKIMPACNCSKGFYGRTCENSSPKDITGIMLDGSELKINAQFLGVQKPFEQVRRVILMMCTPKLKKVTVSVETVPGDGEFYHFMKRKDLECRESIRRDFYTFSRFPYIPLGRDENGKILKFENEVLGYLSSLKLQVQVSSIDYFQYNWTVFVSYQEVNLVCVPSITLHGCSPRWNSDRITVRASHIKISSNVVYIADGRNVDTSYRTQLCEENAKYHWKIWDSYNETNKPINEYYDIRDLAFEPYSLNFRKYKVLLEVTSMREINIAQNFAYCYFSIKSLPLVAMIGDGSERTVVKQHGLILSASAHDPNRPPNKQSHLHAYWSCVDVSEPGREICSPSKPISVHKKYIVPSELLSYGVVYNITLKVWTDHYDNCTSCDNIEPVFDNAMITIADKTDDREDFIYIQCLLNCEKKVVHNQQLYLRVKTSSGSTKNEYEWTYYEEGQTIDKDTKDLTVEGVKLPSFMFITKENAFNSGRNYVIVVRTVNEANNATAKYAFQTLEVQFEGNCTISPTSGTKGVTLFEIQCQNFNNFPIYEFYDKTVAEAESGLIFNGRMLGTSQRSIQGELKDFRVTRGQIIVYIIDESGLYTEKQFTINLLPYNVTQKVIEQLFGNLTDLLDQGEITKMLQYISSVSDIVPIEMDKAGILNDLLHFITLVPTDTLADIKLTTSTMTNVLLALNNPVQLAIAPRLMRNTLHIVRNQTYSFVRIIREGTELHGMSSQEIRRVATYQLDCLQAALMCKDPRTVAITEFDYDLKTLDDLMDSSRFAENAIYLIKDILSLLQTPGQPPTKISATGNSTVLWVVENDGEYNLTNYLSKYDDIPVVVSNEIVEEFGSDLRKNQEELSVRVATLNDNIFWWSKSDVKSNLLSVSLARHSTSNNLGRIKFVKNIVSMQISLRPGLNSTLVKGSVKPYKDPKTKCTLENDLTIEVHRLDPDPRSLITLTFLFPPTNGSLHVLIVRNYRPDCYMMKKARIINETFPTYTIVYNNEEPTFYFIGIIPEANVSVEYAYEVNTTVCQFWAEGHWSSKGCKISVTSKNLDAYCICDHFSIFAAAFPVPPQEIDLFSDINLFLTVLDNPVVVSFVSILLIIYLICCLWAWYKDKKDKYLKNIIILDDNFPEDGFPYLMAIYTSSRFNAGTTAHVGIKINGSLSSSRSHILISKDRKVLKRNYDDWFLIYCPESLGDLQSIHIWHDNSGSSPDWFCDKIIVYDLSNNSEMVFVVEQWIALRLTYFPEATVQRASISEVNNVKRIFLDNCVLGLRENHTLLCIILRHPRSEISRLQRINVLMCCLMTAMLCSIMFYDPLVDDHEYSLGLRDFYISIQSLVISLIATLLVLFAFKRSYKYKYSKTESTVQYRPSAYKEIEVNSKDESPYSNFVRFVTKTMKGTPLVPAQLEHSEPVIIIRRKWRIIAWVLCIGVIITCSFFVMLYGLKLGLIKSKIWLSSVLFTLSEDFFVSTPARIIFISTILSIAFQKICEVDNHRIDKKNLLKIKPQTSEEQIDKMLAKRRHPMYAPLRTDFKNKMLKKKELWSNWWTLIDFTVALCFIFVVSMVVFNLWSSHFYNNNDVKKIMTDESRDSVSFFTFRNLSQVDHFLQYSVLRSLYVTFWYNNDPIKEKDIVREYWAKDFTHTVVGYQRYRQIRVSPVKCKYPLFTNTTRQCIPHYTSGATEDSSDYGFRWLPAQWHDIKQSTSPWKYTDMSKYRFSTLYRLCGKSGEIFHDGGYLTDLGPTRVMADAKAEIFSEEWQDQLTRAVFVEFTLYNVNVNLFSQVTLIVEYLISGSIQLKAQVISVESKMKLSVWKALFCVFVVYYVIRSGYLINRQGLMEYLSTSSRNRSRLLIVFLGCLSIAVAVIHYFSSAADYNSFIKRGYGDTYFDFDSYVHYFILLQVIMSFLLSVAILRTIFIFRGGRTLLNYFYTLTLSLRWVFWLSVVICVFLLVQVPLIIVLNIFSSYTIEEIVLNLKFTQYFKSQSSELKYLQVFLYAKCVVVNCLLYFYIFIFMHYFRIARTYKMRNSDNFNLISFILSHMKRTKTK